MFGSTTKSGLDILTMEFESTMAQSPMFQVIQDAGKLYAAEADFCSETNTQQLHGILRSEGKDPNSLEDLRTFVQEERLRHVPNPSIAKN